jgi:hypothetical protein
VHPCIVTTCHLQPWLTDCAHFTTVRPPVPLQVQVQLMQCTQTTNKTSVLAGYPLIHPPACSYLQRVRSTGSETRPEILPWQEYCSWQISLMYCVSLWVWQNKWSCIPAPASRCLHHTVAVAVQAALISCTCRIIFAGRRVCYASVSQISSDWSVEAGTSFYYWKESYH